MTLETVIVTAMTVSALWNGVNWVLAERRSARWEKLSGEWEALARRWETIAKNDNAVRVTEIAGVRTTSWGDAGRDAP